LVLDEVDQLIVDDRPNASYVAIDTQRSPAMAATFEAFARGDLESIPDSVQKRNAVEAAKRGEVLLKNGRYASVIDKGKTIYVEMDDKGKAMVGYYFRSGEVCACRT